MVRPCASSAVASMSKSASHCSARSSWSARPLGRCEPWQESIPNPHVHGQIARPPSCSGGSRNASGDGPSAPTRPTTPATSLLLPRPQDHRPRRQEHHQPPQRHRRPHHPSPGPHHQPADPQTHRAAVRVDQDDRRRKEAPLHRAKEEPSVVPHGGSRLQHHPDGGPRRASDVTNC